MENNSKCANETFFFLLEGGELKTVIFNSLGSSQFFVGCVCVFVTTQTEKEGPREGDPDSAQGHQAIVGKRQLIKEGQAVVETIYLKGVSSPIFPREPTQTL